METIVSILSGAGGLLLGSLAIGMWYGGGNKTVAIWIGFIGCVCFLLVGAIQMQDYVWKAGIKKAVPNDTEVARSRAYVFIDTIRTNNINDDLIAPNRIASVLIVVKNTGQTPAYGFWQRATIRIAAFPPPADLFDIPPMIPNTVDNLPPGGFAQITVGLGRFLTIDEKTSLGLGLQAVYVFGEIGYRDVFGIKRCTKYRYRVGGDVGFNGTAMAPMREGNEVDKNCTE